jgi:hypothetical protein
MTNLLKFTGKWLAGSAPKADQIGSPEVLAQIQEEWVCADGFESAVEWYGDDAEVARGLPAAAVRWVEHEAPSPVMRRRTSGIFERREYRLCSRWRGSAR